MIFVERYNLACRRLSLGDRTCFDERTAAPLPERVLSIRHRGLRACGKESKALKRCFYEMKRCSAEATGTTDRKEADAILGQISKAKSADSAGNSSETCWAPGHLI